jgi:hypothetical protein
VKEGLAAVGSFNVAALPVGLVVKAHFQVMAFPSASREAVPSKMTVVPTTTI